ncbi:hypothetical protein GUJ93_ZPchr0003g16985 [Zizania palustris]|nr:hypothetical protein GUJ93_ZPchr0003g16985 [Zizania palustris]
MMMQMEKLVKQCDMEVMKVAMLKHEETFKQQVYELHRLYRVQKQLMSDMKRSPELNCRRRQRRKQQLRRRALNLQLIPAGGYIVVGRAREATPPSREDELELTLAVGGGRRNNKRRETSPFTSTNCSGGSLTTSSSSTDSHGALRPPPCPRAMAFDLQDGMSTTTTQPPWVLPHLSLRMA